MRSGGVSQVYAWVVDDVVGKVQRQFAAEGVDPSVLEQLRELWITKLKEAKVYGDEDEQPSRSGVAARADTTQQRQLSKSSSQPKSKLLNFVQAPPQHINGTQNAQRVEPSQQPMPVAVRYPQGSEFSAVPGRDVQQFTLQSMDPSYLQKGMQPMYGVVSVAPQVAGFQRPVGLTGYDGLQVGGAAQGYALPKDMTDGHRKKITRAPVIVGTIGRGGDASEIKAVGVPINPAGGKEQCNSKEVSQSSEEARGGTTASQVAEPAGSGSPSKLPPQDRKRKLTDSQECAPHAANGTCSTFELPSNKTARVNGVTVMHSSIPQHDGANDDEDGIDNEEEDPLLSSEDEDEMFDPPNFLTAQYSRVRRIKNRWRCDLKHGIFHANGRDYLFRTAAGEFTF